MDKVISRETREKVAKLVEYCQTTDEAADQILELLGHEVGEAAILPGVSPGKWIAVKSCTSKTWMVWKDKLPHVCLDVMTEADAVLMAKSKEIVEEVVKVWRSVGGSPGAELTRLLTEVGVKGEKWQARSGIDD